VAVKKSGGRRKLVAASGRKVAVKGPKMVKCGCEKFRQKFFFTICYATGTRSIALRNSEIDHHTEVAYVGEEGGTTGVRDQRVSASVAGLVALQVTRNERICFPLFIHPIGTQANCLIAFGTTDTCGQFFYCGAVLCLLVKKILSCHNRYFLVIHSNYLLLMPIFSV
jgi:hypothetical protein